MCVCVSVLFEFEYVHFERDRRLALTKFPSSAMDWTLHFLLIGLAVLILKRLLSYFFVVQNQLGLSVWNSCEIVNWMSRVQRTWFQEENFDNQLRVSVCWLDCNLFFNYTLSSLIMKASLSIINRLLWLLLLFGSFPGKTLSSQYILPTSNV